MPAPFRSPDDLRALFSRALSGMYRGEVPQYGTLLQLVAEINAATLASDPALAGRLERAGELGRLSEERHGAIRLGTPAELEAVGALFAAMGMEPVGYYDLSVAGIPVHSTAFRPVTDAALARNPFRVFTSLLRLDLVADEGLRAEARAILARRRIVSPRALELAGRARNEGGLLDGDAETFVTEALETFRWHGEATAGADTYRRLRASHPLVADVVCFKGPHINHLTPRTLDIDAVQRLMPERGIVPKAVIEGPPERRCPILLRQTSFMAIAEPIRFPGRDGGLESGTHTARFGEIEARGAALTPEGRARYDALLASVRETAGVDATGAGAQSYDAALNRGFAAFPDDWDALRREKLAFFRYRPTAAGLAAAGTLVTDDPETLVASGHMSADPIVYEDFLPVSAAGIFQSNLGTHGQVNAAPSAGRNAFEAALGRPVADETALYAAAESRSLAAALAALGRGDRLARAS